MKWFIPSFPIFAVLALLGFAPARATETDSLAGWWSFQLDPDDRGITEAWPARINALPDTIKLPGTTDAAGFGTVNTNVEVGVLSRLVKYYGPAWYQREILVPESWRNKDVELFMERVIWESRVWVDGKLCDSQESLNTPHVHYLGRLSPGRHVLTVRIDNRPLYPIGINGHSYTEQTQTIWNGAVGRLELQARDAIHLMQTRVFPDAAQNRARAELSLQNDGSTAQTATVLLQLHKRGSHKIVAETETNFTVSPGKNTLQARVTLAQAPDLWDEFSPNLYTLDATVKTGGTKDGDSQTFGFRAVSRVGQHIAINGRPVFLRGNLDNLNFPLTGYPAMNVDGWKRIFKIYQSYGLNHVRFHTWTPPEAAFTAADELGIYIQAEVVWVQRALGKDTPGRMEGMKFGSFPEELRTPPGTVDRYVHEEMRRVMNAYGNHPSFVLFTIGNEMGSYDPDVCGQWLQEIKDYDPRRLYAISTARRIAPQDDFNVTHAIPNVGWCRDKLVPYNDWDYETIYAQAPVPIIAHEVGQWPAFPVWEEIRKYTGVLRARNYEHFRFLAESNGVAGLDHEFRAASGAISQRLYKDEIESHLRTADCSGFDLLSLQDYSGQGEALVGWLDSFYDSKGIVSPERFRRWCSATVPLARLPKYLYGTGETLTARVDVAHYGPKPLAGVTASWSLREGHGRILDHGKLAPANLPLSSVTTLGDFTAKLTGCPVPCQARLEVKLDGTPFANDWDIWVFPAANTLPATGGVVICDSVETALANLRTGKKVLFDAHELGTKDNASYAHFKPAYWSAWMFQGQYTLGALVHDTHPALAQFPTQNHYDWQWEELCRTGRGFRLDGLPLDYQPIVQPIGDFHFGWKLGTVFELRVGEGRLLVCGYDLSSRLDQRPAARQLRASLLDYMNSSGFAPRMEADAALLNKIFPLVRTAPIAMPKGFDHAVLYVKAGAKDLTGGDVPWKPELDEARITEAGFGYGIECNAVWKDGDGTAWWSDSTLRIQVRIPKPAIYDLYVHFDDWNNNGRTGKIKFAGREYELGAHTGQGKWVKLEVLREDCLDGRITVEATPTAGPNLQVTEIALVPR